MEFMFINKTFLFLDENQQNNFHDQILTQLFFFINKMSNFKQVVKFFFFMLSKLKSIK